ncbi:MAG: hypothetical protein R3C26_20105 [Calditrichia bacterium]
MAFETLTHGFAEGETIALRQADGSGAEVESERSFGTAKGPEYLALLK